MPPGITFLNWLARMRGIADGWMECLCRDSRIDGEFSPASQDVQVPRIWARVRALASTAYPLDRAGVLLLMSWASATEAARAESAAARRDLTRQQFTRAHVW